jgi:hypothetical protein
MLKISFCKWVSYPTRKSVMIPWCLLFLVLSGKYSWVPSRTQGFVLTCCRWTDVLRLLYQLHLSCDGRSLGPWAMVIHYISSDAFVGRWSGASTVFWTLYECVIWTKRFRYFLWNWFVITMFKLRCICDANFYVTCDGDRWTYYDLGWYVSWFEIRREFMDCRVIRA